jgi:hypothetical protein
MAKVLSSISLDSPASPVTDDTGATFAFAGTPSLAGGGGVQRYDFKWEVDSGGGYVTIGAATGLTTADTNPLVNTNSQTQNSITVTCTDVGSYTIRIVGAPTSGGSYTVVSSTQTVEVQAAANPITVTPGLATLITSTLVPTVTATNHITVTPPLATLTVSGLAPTVTATEGSDVTVTPDVAALLLSTFAPSASVTAHQTLIPAAASLDTTVFAPSVVVTDHQAAVPSPASLSLTTFIPSIVTTDPQLVTPDTAVLTTTTFGPSIYAGTTVVTGIGALSLTSYAPAVALTDDQLITPEAAAVALSSFAPSIVTEGPQTITPGMATLALMAFSPSLAAPVLSVDQRGIHATIAVEAGLSAGISLDGLRASITPGVGVTADLDES